MGSSQKEISYPVLKSSWVRLDKIERLYQIDIPIIGLTGGIATGKSSFAHYLREKGVHVIDADLLIKKIYQKQDVIDFVKKNVPGAFEDGRINFRHLREHVFGHMELKQNLEQFLYAHMPQAFQDEANLQPQATWLVYDVPLLFERSLNFRVDQSVVVYTTPEVQLERLMKRDHINEEFAQRIIATQMPIEEKKKRADYVLDNSGDLEDHPKIFSKFWQDLVVI